MNFTWFPAIYLEILYFVISPQKAPLWLQCFLFSLGTFLAGIVMGTERLRP